MAGHPDLSAARAAAALRGGDGPSVCASLCHCAPLGAQLAVAARLPDSLQTLGRRTQSSRRPVIHGHSRKFRPSMLGTIQGPAVLWMAESANNGSQQQQSGVHSMEISRHAARLACFSTMPQSRGTADIWAECLPPAVAARTADRACRPWDGSRAAMPLRFSCACTMGLDAMPARCTTIGQ